MSYNMQSAAESLQTQEQDRWVILHLSQLANIIIPFAGFITDVLWQTQKDKMPALDAHGKMVVNWIFIAYLLIVSGVLAIVLIGF